MNKVITINLGGVAFQLEDAGYDALRAYLETAKARLQGNPDRDEILSDIERAISEKFAARLSPHKNVVLEKEVADVIAEMGEVADEAAGAGAKSDPAAGASTGAASSASNSAHTAKDDGPRRLFRVLEGRQIAGVCNGLGLYFDVDPSWFRFGFLMAAVLWGTGILAYCILLLVMPVARTPEEKAQATGNPATAQEFIRRAKEGYYDAVKSFPDKQARREWKRRFRQEMREWKSGFHANIAANAEQWRAQCGPRPWPVSPGAGLFLPMFSLLHGVLILFFVLTLISLFAHGHLLGVAVPVGIPVWVAAVLLIFAFGVLTWPLKAARRAYYYASATSGPAGALFWLVDLFVWIFVVIVFLGVARHHFPEIREALHNVPAVFQDAANSVRDWWHGHG
jgi:phage shock protein PspC (stress-responsive transcriptional regulator)